MSVVEVDEPHEVGALHGVVAYDGSIARLAICAVHCHDAIILQAAQIVNKGQRAPGGYEHLDALLTYPSYGLYGRIGDGMAVERYERTVDIKKDGAYHR